MTSQIWKPQAGILPIPRGSRVYIMQAPEEATRNNREIGTGHRAIIAQAQSWRPHFQ